MMHEDLQSAQVSIILPVYNAGEGVLPTLRSIAAQSLKRIEIIAVDDGSSDDSYAVLENFAQTEPRLKVLRLPENGGQYAARIAGIRSATAPWVGFIDADDFAAETMFQRLYDTCVRTGSDIAICGSDLVTVQGEFIQKKVSFAKDETFVGNCFETYCSWGFGSGVMWNKLYKKELVDRYATQHFRWEPEGAEDTLCNIGCFYEASRVSVISDTLHQYVRHEKSVTQSTECVNAYLNLLRAFALAIEVYQDWGPQALGMIAKLYKRQLDFRAYHVGEAEDYEGRRADFEKIVRFIANSYPLGLAIIANRHRPRAVTSSGLTVRIRRFLRATRNLFRCR